MKGVGLFYLHSAGLWSKIYFPSITYILLTWFFRWRASIQEEEERKRIEDLKTQRQQRISGRTASSVNKLTTNSHLSRQQQLKPIPTSKLSLSFQKSRTSPGLSRPHFHSFFFLIFLLVIPGFLRGKFRVLVLFQIFLSYFYSLSWHYV